MSEVTLERLLPKRSNVDRGSGRAGAETPRIGSETEFGEIDWRARSENCASVRFLSPRYLKIEYLKRYVGGLVYFDGSTSVYRALREVTYVVDRL